MKATSSLLKLLAAVVAAVITTSCTIETQTDRRGNSVTRTSFTPLAGVGMYSNTTIGGFGGYGRGCYGAMPMYNQVPQGCYPRTMRGGQVVVFRGPNPVGYCQQPVFTGPPTMGTPGNPILVKSGNRVVAAFDMNNPSGFIGR